jgi:hypothetical protein
MNTVPLFVAYARLYELGTFMGVEQVISFDPIPAQDLMTCVSKLLIRIPETRTPAMVCQLPESWIVTTEHGMTNVEMVQPVSIHGERRRHVPPMLLAVWARTGQEGVLRTWGSDPLNPELTDRDIMTQRTMFAEAMEGVKP